jgi:hypothetical protein
MTRYWDASALVDALHDTNVETKALEPGQVTRVHTLAETFSTLTGGRLGFQYLPDDAAALIAEMTADFVFVELTEAEVKAALATAQQRGVRGGRVHDLLHAIAAQKARVAEVVTDNISDFEGLTGNIPIRRP